MRRCTVAELTTLPIMRRFIVMNPNLSVGRQGDIVTADELKMSDEKLDEWVAANHGIEIDDTSVVVTGDEYDGEVEGGSTHVGFVDEDYEDVWDDDED